MVIRPLQVWDGGAHKYLRPVSSDSGRVHFQDLVARSSVAAAIGFRRPGEKVVPREGGVPSEAGEIPALSRNGDASSEDKPGRLASANDLSSEEGRLVPMPPFGVAADALRPPNNGG